MKPARGCRSHRRVRSTGSRPHGRDHFRKYLSPPLPVADDTSHPQTPRHARSNGRCAARPASCIEAYFTTRYRPIVNYPVKMLLISPLSILRRRLIFTSANFAQFWKNTTMHAASVAAKARNCYHAIRGELCPLIVTHFLSAVFHQGRWSRFSFAVLTGLPSGPALLRIDRCTVMTAGDISKITWVCKSRPNCHN